MSDALTLSKFRHSCLLIEVGGTRLLLDPGVFSSGFEPLNDLAGVLITHQHPDHLDLGRLTTLLQANPQAQILADSASAAQLVDAGFSPTVVEGGDTATVDGVAIEVFGGKHAEIAPGVPVPPNVGYAIDGRFAYAGDAYMSPPEPVQVLAIPTLAPWLKASETVSFLQQVRPRSVVPVHEALLASPDLYYGLYQRFAGEQDTAFHNLDDGQPVTF